MATNLIFVAGTVTYNSLIYVDQLPDPRPQTIFSSRFHETVGGTAAGKALALNRLDVPVVLHTVLGDDEPGQRIRDYLANEHLQVITDLDPAGTERHVNLMDKDGRRISIYVSYGTFDLVPDLNMIESQLAQCDGVVLDIKNYCRQIIPLAQRHHKPIWCDIHDYDGQNEYHAEFITAADYLFMSSDAMPDYRQFMEAQIEAGKRLVVCTHGKRGATALTPEQAWVEVSALEYSLHDSNGAGDNFFAGFFYGYANDYSPASCLRLGTVAGGLAVTSSELICTTLTPELMEAEYRRHYKSSP